MCVCVCVRAGRGTGRVEEEGPMQELAHNSLKSFFLAA